MKEVASLRYGVIFKKAFSDPDIFKAFVKDFLGIELNIDKVEMEKSFDPPIGNVDSRFDLFAEDKKNPSYNGFGGVFFLSTRQAETKRLCNQLS